MAILSINDFKQTISQILQDPRRDRITSDSPSAEIYDRFGNKISGIKIKFFLEDDGGDWDDGLKKPQYIWDMKKIVSQIVLDDGYHFDDSGNTIEPVNLTPNNVVETNDGIYFNNSSNSYLESIDQSIDAQYLGTSQFLFNMWFTPDEHNFANANLFQMNDASANWNLYVGFNGLTSTTYQVVFIVDNSTMQTISDSLTINQKQHLLIFVSGTSLKAYLNGSLKINTSIAGALSWYDPFKIKIGELYKGEVSYISMNFLDSVQLTEDMVLNYYRFGYPLPRGKELVDITDPVNGLDLFLDINNIDKAIETVKGNLYMKGNSIKVKNG